MKNSVFIDGPIIKTSIRKVVALAVGMMLAGFVMSCASTGSPSKKASADSETKGFLHGYYQYLRPGPKGAAKMRWIKPGVDIGKYNKVMLDSVIFFFADDSESKGINAHDMKELADECNLQVFDVLNDTYPIVAEPGPDVLRLRMAITDLKQSRPALSAVTTVIPVGMAISVVRKGAGGSWTGSGATSAEFMAVDSATNEVIGVAQDEKKAGFEERFTKWGSTEEACQFWAERLKFILDQSRTHGMTQ